MEPLPLPSADWAGPVPIERVNPEGGYWPASRIIRELILATEGPINPHRLAALRADAMDWARQYMRGLP